MKEIGVWIVIALLAAGGLTAIVALRGIAMRYVLAMVMAAGAALCATLVLSGPVATYVTSQMRFESPDGAADVHMFTFLGVNAAALIVGWALGWFGSGTILKSRHID